MSECLVQVLSPIVVDDVVVTCGNVTLPESVADEHDNAGRVAIISRGEVPEQWAGCCNHEADI